MIIILAAVVILTLSKNNPIESAKEARFKEDVRTFQEELSMYIAKDYTNKGGARDDKITATNYNHEGDPASVYTYIPSFSKKYEGKFVIKNDELVYNEDKLNDEEKIYVSNLNVNKNIKSGVEMVEESPSTIYGKTVNYKTGNIDIDTDIPEWKIFYSDGSNVYIISSNYVHPDYLPSKDGAKPDQGDATNYPRAARFNNNIISKYSGSASIIDEKMKAFNSDYFKERVNEETGETYVFSSEYRNMKSVAYMLDKDIWGNFVNSSVAEYAVGGPSVEMLMKSYLQKYAEDKIDYRARAKNEIGYEMSIDSGKENTWSTDHSGMLNTSDRLYVLESATISGANGMWLSSPSAAYNQNLIYVSGGYVGAYDSNRTYTGFRPLVCLRSDILLNWNDTTQKYDIE